MEPAPLRASLGAKVAALRAYAAAHKLVSGIVLVAVLWGGWSAYGMVTAPSTATRYVTTTVATGTVVATLSETGQVSASRELALTPQASGEIVGMYVTPGEHVSAGQVIGQLDATDAKQALADAELSLQTAELTYAQDTATSTLSLNLLTAQNGVTNAETSLAKTRDSSYASIASVYTDLATVLNGLDTVLHGYNVTGRTSQTNLNAYRDIVSANDTNINPFQTSAQSSYDAAVAAYDTAVLAYKATPRSATDEELTTLAQQTYAATETVADAVKDAHDFFDRVSTDYTLYNYQSSSVLAGLITSVNGYTATVTTDLSNALTVKTDIISAEQAVAVAQNTLDMTEGGANALTLQSAALTLKKAQEAVTTAKQNLSDYTVVAPFSGTVASVPVKVYDQASSGTTMATLITDQNTLTISVNEVDASKLKTGQKATVTFDALPGVTLAGTVSEIDTLGTVSQGVVSYDATITFDTANAAVKPGMSATANVIVDSGTGLVVPASAVKTAGTQSYVEVFTPPLSGSFAPGGAESPVPPSRVMVTAGLTDNTETLITAGLSAGEQVVTSTIAGTAQTSASAAPSIFNAAGARGGAVRAGGGGAVFRAVGG
ncbi:efflux RND transporter periplasmic adaptor subunit [Patescibacteria group bacterium]|nr:efflux RND transporter periplasmic adaptor subunit [Patescibacteria group bacterium]